MVFLKVNNANFLLVNYMKQVKFYRSEKYVCVINMLGYNEMMANQSPEEVFDYLAIFRLHLQQALMGGETIYTSNGQLIFDLKDSQICSTMISNKLVFWTADDSCKSFILLLRIVKKFVSFCHNRSFRYVRGALTFGHFYFLDQGANQSVLSQTQQHFLLFGKALSNAEELERNINLIGVVVDDSALRQAKANHVQHFEQFFAEALATFEMFYSLIPLKTGKSEKFYSICWVSKSNIPKREKIHQAFFLDNKNVDIVNVRLIVHSMRYFDEVKLRMQRQATLGM